MNRRITIISLVLVAAVLAAACSGIPAQEPTGIPPTVALAATQAPPTAGPATARPTAAATVAAPTARPPTVLAPTVAPCLITACTATPAATNQPQAADAILILAPGSNSSVASPVRVTGEADPTFEQNLVVQISDASGAVLATQPATIQNGAAGRGPFEATVPFTIHTDGAGRISVYATSARDGGLVHLASVEVTLMSRGTAAVTAGQLHNETHIILQPVPQASVSGGVVHVSGFSDYVFESQLALELCGQGGAGAPDPVCGTTDNVLGTGVAMLQAADAGQPGPFAGDLTYTVSAPGAARLVVLSRSARDGGIVHLSSVPVQLAP